VSVKRRLDTGKWEVRWRENARNRSKSFRLKADADRWWLEVERRKRLGTLAQLTAVDQTLAEFVEEYWRVYAIPVLSQKTRSDYRQVWGKHALPRLGGVNLRELSPRRMSLFMADLRDQGVGEPSILKTLTMLQSVFASAVEEGALQTNPAAGVRNRPRQRPTRVVSPVAPAQVECFRHRLEQHGSRGATSATVISVMAYAGLRPGETLALRWSDVGTRTLHITRSLALGSEKDTKTGGTRTVRLLTPLADDLDQLRAQSGDSELLFPRAAGGAWQDHDWRNWRRRVFQRAAASEGMPGVRPYDLRHSFVSLLIQEGQSILEVARQAGHSPQTCLRTYAHLFDDFDPAERRPAEDVIREARAQLDVREMYAVEGAAT
jgi:integrase